jgi:hypothetical protein
MLELRAREVRLKRKIFSVAESRRRVVFTARPEDPGATLDPGKKGVRRKTVRQSENVVRAAGPTHVGGVMAKCLWQSFTSIIGHKRGYLMSHIGDRQRCATYRGVRSHNPVWDQLRGRRGGGIDLSSVRVADNLTLDLLPIYTTRRGGSMP